MKRILVANPDIPLTDFVKSRIIKAGYDCDAVYDSEQILSRCKNKAVDLIVLDALLKPCRGDEVIATLKNALANQMPLIIMTYTFGRKEQRFPGADAYLHKPFNPDDLVKLIHDLLKEVAQSS